MPRAELPAIIPLRQFGEDTWLAPGVIKPVGDARASFALNGETVTVRDGRCARADGRLAGACLATASAVRNCVSPAQRAADDGAAVCFHSSGGISRPRQQAW